jgi:hypothetical protein
MELGLVGETHCSVSLKKAGAASIRMKPESQFLGGSHLIFNHMQSLVGQGILKTANRRNHILYSFVMIDSDLINGCLIGIGILFRLGLPEFRYQVRINQTVERGNLGEVYPVAPFTMRFPLEPLPSRLELEKKPTLCRQDPQ